MLVTGAAGQLGRYLRLALQERGATTIGLGARSADGIDITADITDATALKSALHSARPGAVIHAAAYTDVDGCERDPARANAVNAVGSGLVAAAAQAANAYLIAVGTDFVFSGDGGAPYSEDAPPLPVSVYGRSKLAGEEAVLALDSGFAVARTAWLYGGSGKHFPRTVLTILRDHGTMEVVNDEVGSPTFAGDLAEALVSLLSVRGEGIFHLVNAGRATRFALAQAVAEAAGFDPGLIVPTTSAAFLAKYPLPARRPADSTLANWRAAALGITLRPWSDAVADYIPRLAAELDLAGGRSALREA
ncbi:MAG: dTDP-4-dehydrorhamnose reductase [Thermomicrobiales bacterium]